MPKKSIFFENAAAKAEEAQRFKLLADHSARTCNPIPTLPYQLAIADINYGLAKKKSRKDIKWLYQHFFGYFMNLNAANTSDTCVVIMFLHDSQIHVCLCLCRTFVCSLCVIISTY